MAGHWRAPAVQRHLPHRGRLEGQPPRGRACEAPRVGAAAGAGGGGAPQGTEESGALFRSHDVGETWEIGSPSKLAKVLARAEDGQPLTPILVAPNSHNNHEVVLHGGNHLAKAYIQNIVLC